MDAESTRHNQLAREASARNRPDLAEASLRRLLARDPKQAWAMTALAASLHHQRRYEEAAAQARRAVQSYPAYGFAHFTLGIALSILEDLDDSLRHALEAMRLAPTNSRYYGLPVILYLELERFDDAIGILRGGLALEPDSPTLQRLLASSLAGNQDRDAAWAVMAEVFRLAPDRATTFLTAGVVSWRLRDFLDADDWLRKALALNPLSYDAHGILGFVLLELGRAEEAAFHLHESLQLNRYTGRVQSALERAERMCREPSGDAE